MRNDLVSRFRLWFSFYILLSSFNCFKTTNGQVPASCEGFKFRCGTNECIDIEKRCNGVVDCIDGSDEFNDCKDIQCPGFLFTCDYGACIESDKKCNGKKDCRDNSDEANCVTDQANKISSNCKSDQFECNSGQCISLDQKCNGTPECEDKSDETKDTCLNMPCPGFTFKCDYGACVDGFAKCNGQKDCVDNSDEEDCGPKVTPVPPTTGGQIPSSSDDKTSCVLPNHPDNGQWALWPMNQGIKKSPRDKVPESTIIEFTCKSDYKLGSPTGLVACVGGSWNVQVMPICKKKCPPFYTTAATNIKCYSTINGRSEVIKCDEATDDDQATFSCAPYYEQTDLNRGIRVCWGGLWNYPAPICQPVCGQKRVTAEPLIVNGRKVAKGDYPWVSALYKLVTGEFVNVCGGSILTQKVILTAAHCVTNDHGDVEPREGFMVAVGKYYNKYKDSRDTEAQYSQVEKIVIPAAYKADRQNYANDIAVLITQDVLLLSKVVQPICFQDLPNIFLDSGLIGVVAGWGFTVSDGSPAEELREVDIPFKQDSECYKELPEEWVDRYKTVDKMCAGHYNKSIAVCKGDSGSGLAFQNYKSDKRYYVHGIVSVSHGLKQGCNIQASAFYTKVAYHYEWLERTIAQYSRIV